MANVTTIIHPSNLSLPPETDPLSYVSMQAYKIYPFQNGWNVAYFVILIAFILTVLSLASLAFLYGLLNCGCCTTGKKYQQLEREKLGTYSEFMINICTQYESPKEVV